MRFEIGITGLHKPQGDVAAKLGGIFQFSDAEVNIPLNEARTARVRVSMHDPIVKEVKAYERFLKIYYYNKLVFWGAITEPEFDFSTQTVLITAMDPSVRLRYNFVRLGDPAERKSTDNGFKGNIPQDYRGLRMLVDCARNLPEQDDRNSPNLGVQEGSANSPSLLRLAVERGTEVWATMVDISGSIPGVDFELAPVEESWPYYCRLNCYDKQGTDRSNDVVFHAGFGKQNLEDMTWTPGGRIVTHAHVLDVDGKFRQTAVDVAASNRYGTYIWWDATDWKVTDEDDVEVLQERGKEILDAYSHPPDYHTITPIQDSGYVYGRDYGVGDYVSSAIRAGYVSHEMKARVTEVTLSQADGRGEAKEALTLVPDVTDDAA